MLCWCLVVQQFRAFDPVCCVPTSWDQRSLFIVAYPFLHCRPLMSSFPNQYSINDFRSHSRSAPNSMEDVGLVLYWLWHKPIFTLQGYMHDNKPMYIELTLMDVTLLRPTPNNECGGLIMLFVSYRNNLKLYKLRRVISSTWEAKFQESGYVIIIIKSNTLSKLKRDCFANMIICWSLVLYSLRALLNLKFTIWHFRPS